jgi:AcrR family transcriptional regulator
MVTDAIPDRQQTGKNRKAQAAAATRERLLQAAISVIQERGIERLTLDTVAKAAQVSKGGLLYHFASKEALVVGIIEYLVDDFDAAIAHELAVDNASESPGQYLRAYVRATFNYKHLPMVLISNLLAAVTLDPELLKPMQRRAEHWQQQIHVSGLDPVLANLISLAADGLGTNELFGIGLPEPALRQQLLEKLLGMIHEAETSDRVITTRLERSIGN